MRSALWAAPGFLLLFTGCPDDAQWGSDPSERDSVTTGTGDQLQAIRKAGALAPTVYVSVELSALAVRRFRGLDLMLYVYSSESLEGQGLRAQWLGEPGGGPVHGDFGGEWSASWSDGFYVASNPCAAAPCVLSLELAPEGDWHSELSFAVEYDVVAVLELEGADSSRLDSVMDVTLEASP
jgi:hypothetical protein